MALIRITENIIFDNVTKVLYSEERPDIKKSLGLSAVYCLETLIAAKGEPVSQEQLLFEGWRQHGIEVSPDSVRQVISQIRKALKNLNESPNILITLPKIGYQLIITDKAQEEKASSHSETAIIESFLNIRRVLAYLPRKYEFYIVIFFLLANFMAVVMIFLPNVSYSPQVIHYKKIAVKSMPTKNILINEKMFIDMDKITENLTLLEESPFWKEDNKNYQWIYINNTYSPKLFNLFICDRDISDINVKCVTRIFWKE